ncbi:cytochrome b-c1 complex subunit 10 [Cytidiella melzeri]|nr:cytochrome b-c1 complex subunit 10 [Cytidiella melzeri]
MSRVVFHPRTAAKLSNDLVRKWTPSAALWGAGAGLFALYLLSVTPLVKRTFLVKVPALGSYYEDKTPACDKPF